MVLEYKTPGVIIEEIPATGPIAGVGTSTTAFIGPALSGPIAVPVKITNWTEYRGTFGEYQAVPPLYLPHAVRGYFDNGGRVAYIVRVGTARRASVTLADRGTPAGTALRVEATHEGESGATITVNVADAAIVGPGAATVRRANVDGDPGAAVADLRVGQTRFRVEPPTGIQPGTVLHLDNGTNSEDVVVEKIAGDVVTLAGSGLTNAYGLQPANPDVDVTTREFTLTISRAQPAPPIEEKFALLSMDPRHSRYIGRVVDSTLVNVIVPEEPSIQPAPGNLPAATTGPVALTGGADDVVAEIGPSHYEAALAALERVDDVALVVAPAAGVNAQKKVTAHCLAMADRFAILDSDRGAAPFGAGSVTTHAAGVTTDRGYAALYYPWILVGDPTSPSGSGTLLVPPSGHLAGIYARSDGQRGVHKAPANEYITSARGLERILTDTEQGELNEVSVNCLRIFAGQPPIVWGARALAPKEQTEWRYVNVRRLFLFVEESVQEGIRWAVFEPNDRSLWKKLDRTITEFLTRVWRSGALFGKTAAEAFYVRIDDELNPPAQRTLGQVVIEIGLAPVRPAEFVVVRIAMWDGGSASVE